MTRKLRSIIRNILPVFLYRRFASIRRYCSDWESVRQWKRAGKPAPPPQFIKQKNLVSVAEKYRINILVETGTYRGTTIAAVQDYFNQVFSIELSEELYLESVRKFNNNRKITLIHGDSGRALSGLIDLLDEPAHFWLDAHYSGGITAKGNKTTAVVSELTHILSDRRFFHYIMVDDARLFNGVDDYPSMDQLVELVRSLRTSYTLEVVDDAIRILPELRWSS